MAEFNLIDEPWIPCVDLHGEHVEYGIRDTLLKAHDLREVCDDSPLVTVAIYRILLAILYRAFKGPSGISQWKDLYQRNAFEKDGSPVDYLIKWHERFFLFDDSYPFIQVAELDLNEYRDNGELKKDKSDGMMRLAKEAPDKAGRILFDHRVGTERPEYEPEQIARMILAAQSYAGTGVASGGRVGSRSIQPTACQFAPCVDGLLLWLQGDNLFETLMFNLVPREFNARDLPAWEDDHIVKSAITSWISPVRFTGPVQRFAPLSRFIFAVDRKSIFFTNGLKILDDSDDPMKTYFRESEAKPYVASKLLEYKAAWRDAHTLFAVGISNHKPPESFNFMARLSGEGIVEAGVRYRAHVVGLATKRDKGLLWRHERMPVSGELLNNVNLIERLGALLQSSEQVGSELNYRARRLAKLYLSPQSESPDARQPDKDEVTKVIETIDPRRIYWTRLEQHFFSLLEDLPNDWDGTRKDWRPDDQQVATKTWREHVKDGAQQSLEESMRSLGTTARALQAIARVRTDFNDEDLKPLPQKTAKAKRKSKGGKKK